MARRLGATDPALPLTLFLPSWAVDASRALDLITDALATCTGIRDTQLWSRRAETFAKRTPKKRPVILLVLDGINEQPLFDWRTLLESLQVSPWKDQVATILTCRPAHWHEFLAPRFRNAFQIFEIGLYDDNELANALEMGGLQAHNLPSTLEPLLRRPRYLDLTIRYREALEQSGDVTVDRLLYEDWKDRASRKRGLFSDQEFRTLLVQLAERYRNSLFSKREIQDLVPRGNDLLSGLDEIITGGIFVRDSLGRYAVEPHRLVQGFGLLLADQVQNLSNKGESAMREAMASFLEPHADMDRKVAILRSAVTFAVIEPGFPETARFILFEQWIGNRNLSREDIESVTAYLPASPASYLRLVERFWTIRRANHQAQRLLVRAFFRWRDNTKIHQALVNTCEKWLSYVHPYGYRFMQGQDDMYREKLRREIEERAGQPLRPGEKFLLADELEVIEDGNSLWLSEPALLLASLFAIEPFVPALRRWALSRSVMGHAEEAAVVAWLLRWRGEDLWPALEVAIVPLLAMSRVAQQAAWQLLWACGREEAAPVLELLPEDLFPHTYYQETYKEDPCRPFWRREDCAMCAARADLPDRLVVLKLSPHALDPDLRIDFDLRPRLQRALSSIRTDQISSGPMTTVEDNELRRMEPTLAAFAPELLAETYRALVRDIPKRSQESRQVLLSRLTSILLLLKGRERRVLRVTWDGACLTQNWNDESYHDEVDLFAALLFDVPAKTQLDLLLRRPQEAFDDLDLGLFFKRLSTGHVQTLAQSLFKSTPRDLQRKLWYLWYQPAVPVVEVLGAELLVSLLDHPDPVTQNIARHWLFRSGSDEVFDLAIECNQITPALTQFMRQSWGRWFAVRMRSRLSYETLSRAIDFGSLSYIVRKRPRDLAFYTRDLDRAIKNAVRTESEIFETGFCKETLRSILKRDPQVVEDWIQLAIGQRDPWSSLMESCHMIFELLCEILLEKDPARGSELFQALLSYRSHARTVEAPTGVDVLALTLFRVPRSRHVETLLDEWLDDCITDKDLFELALAASAVRNEQRLEELIRQRLSSAIPVERAVAIALAGFAVPGSQSAAILESIQLHPEGWLHKIREQARRHLYRNRWAQRWFRRFAASPNTEESFAAFRLFLRCVDRRYWIWKDDVLEGVRLSPKRRQYWAINRDRINRAITENEKDREKHFLGREIPEGKVHPWLSSYLR